MISPAKIGMPADSGRIDIEKSIGHGRAIRGTNRPVFLIETSTHSLRNQFHWV
jgi:hypothetical protein